jgi:hypothetical protein
MAVIVRCDERVIVSSSKKSIEAFPSGLAHRAANVAENIGRCRKATIV